MNSFFTAASLVSPDFFFLFRHCLLRHFGSGRRKTGSRLYVVLIDREFYHNAIDRADLRFAVRTTCKQLNSIKKRSHYIRLL